MGNRFGKSITVVRDEYIATNGVALKAWKDGEPYAFITICVPEIPLEENEVILNHDIQWDAKFTSEFLDYMCDTTDGIKRVKYGHAESYIVKLKDGWKDLCMTDEEFYGGRDNI